MVGRGDQCPGFVESVALVPAPHGENRLRTLGAPAASREIEPGKVLPGEHELNAGLLELIRLSPFVQDGVRTNRKWEDKLEALFDRARASDDCSAVASGDASLAGNALVAGL